MAPQQSGSTTASLIEDGMMKDVAAFEAAALEITELIGKEGCVDSNRCLEIIQEKAAIANLVERHFPNALSSAQILEKVAPVIEKRGYTDDNTLFAQSVCPDEINHEEGDITDLFTKYLGEVFHLGGLAGIPFTGKTGFGAFSHHVPDDGHCFVMMAPHIGLDDSSILGKYFRDGQGDSGAACGAAVGAFAHCCSGKPLPSLVDNPDDYQMGYIMHRINQVKDKILEFPDENSQQAALAKETHGIAKEMLDKIVDVDFGSKTSTLVILTGVQINMPNPFDDYFQPLNFYILDKEGQKTDLFEETFGVRMSSPRPPRKISTPPKPVAPPATSTSQAKVVEKEANKTKTMSKSARLVFSQDEGGDDWC